MAHLAITGLKFFNKLQLCYYTHFILLPYNWIFSLTWLLSFYNHNIKESACFAPILYVNHFDIFLCPPRA